MAVDFLRYKFEDGVPAEEGHNKENKRFGIGIRHVQIIYMFVCTVTMYVLRGSMSIALLAMTADSIGTDEDDATKTFSWNKKTQAVIFSSFYFGYVLMMIPSEMCVKKFNGKYILFFVLLINGFLCITLPIVSVKGDWIAVANAQLLMGMTQSCVMPAMQLLLKKWLPSNERKLYGSFVYAGSIVGIIISMPLTSLFAESVMYWRTIFYSWAMMVLSMATIWCFLTAGAPAQQEALGDEEKAYIEAEQACQNMTPRVPWKIIIKAKPFWAILAAHVGYQIIYIFFLFAIPIYFQNLLNLPTKDIGWCSSLPFVVMWTMILMLFPTTDSIYKNGLLSYMFSITYYRKLMNTVGCLGVILGLSILTSLSMEHKTLAVIVTVGTYGSTAFMFSGFLDNHKDLVPNFSGSVLTMTSLMANVIGSFVPLGVGVILDLDISVSLKWRILFFSISTMCVICNIIYVTWGNCTKLSWSPYAFQRCNTHEDNKIVMEELTQTNGGYKDDV